MNTLVKGTILGGLVAFIASMIFWMAFPLHMDGLNKVPNEYRMAQAIKREIPKAGIYVLPNMKTPNMEEHHKKMAKGPYVYMMVRPQGIAPSMSGMMLKGLLLHGLLAFILTWIVSQLSNASYWQKVGVALVAAFAGNLYAHLGYLNWWFFPADYTFIYLLDVIFVWGLAGLVIAKISKA